MADNIHDSKKKQRLWNPETLELLRKKGSNMSLVHSITNVFYTNNEEKISILDNLLKVNNFTLIKIADEINEAGELYWSVEANIDFVPDLDRLNEMTDLCIELAFQVGCEYDGWFTETIK